MIRHKHTILILSKDFIFLTLSSEFWIIHFCFFFNNHQILFKIRLKSVKQNQNLFLETAYHEIPFTVIILVMNLCFLHPMY